MSNLLVDKYAIVRNINTNRKFLDEWENQDIKQYFYMMLSTQQQEYLEKLPNNEFKKTIITMIKTDDNLNKNQTTSNIIGRIIKFIKFW